MRILEAPNLSDPTEDLVAAYARLTKTDLEFRFDLLGSPDPFGYDLYVAIDTGAGGGGHLPLDAHPEMNWDIALGFPARGLPRAFNAAGNALSIRPRILRDGVLDSAIIRISRKELAGEPAQYRVFAYLVKTGENQIRDSIGPLLVSGSPPKSQAPLVLAFWDVFPSATPAQALRRWSGAHTGPYGQRHGLNILLNAAAQSDIPITLLDLKRPEQLSALETVGGLPFVRQMQQEKLLLLPDVSYGDPQVSQTSRQMSQSAGGKYKFPAVPFLYSTSSITTPDSLGKSETTRAVFVHQKDSRHILLWNNVRLIPLPEPAAIENAQVDGEGPTAAVRTALLHAALSGDSASLTVLGGDLPNSPWGDSLNASPALRYIAGHPWIHTLDAEDLLNFPAIEGVYECSTDYCPPEQADSYPNQAHIRQALETAPTGLFRDLAWQTYLRLTEPTADTRLQALRAGYIGQVNLLLSAARWDAAPEEQSTCAEDINGDGAADCVLSSRNVFLILDPLGGSLVFAAAREGNESFQWVGPRSQFVVGLGDALEWQPERGLAGDPQEIHGAFAYPPAAGENVWQLYQAETKPGAITLTNPLNGTRKMFQITESGVLATIESQQPSPAQIPLALIDQRTYDPGGFSRYHLTLGKQTNTWKMDQGPSLSIKIDGTQAVMNSFADSRALLSSMEDPNIGYPPGHFIPYPLAVIELHPQGSYSVEFRFKEQ